MPQKARIAVIGAGWWATDYHIPGALSHPGAELVAVCEPHEGRLASAARAFHLHQTYADYREMLDHETLDGAVIVTPHATHYPIARDCLAHGLHVLIEKPMTLTARDARDLVQMAQQREREIMIGYTLHELSQVQRARQAILGGELGAIQYVNCSFSSNVIGFLSGRVSPDYSPTKFTVHGPSENYNKPHLLGGGQGHLQLTHPIGMLLYITGLRPKRVQAMMNNFGLAVDLVDAFAVEFEGGVLGVIGGTGNAGGNYRTALAVYAEAGCYLTDSLADYAALRKKDGQEERLSWEDRSQHKYAVTHNFIDMISGKPANHAPGETGWRAVELLDAAYRSVAEQGRAVEIAELYE